jgi:hypothetical protein
MPSSESVASFRKQEIGRPRWVPPFDSTGVAGMNHRIGDVVVQALGMRIVVGIGRGDAANMSW